MTASASTILTKLLIDGQLVGAGGGTFTTFNPATEEPLGEAADADATDMDRAIAAARVAFDESDWSRDVALRVHCLRQLRTALNEQLETLRDITVAEVGAPVVLTRSAQLQGPVDDLEFAAAPAEN
jgi:aldehyde dehydrogenase (NAD+)